MLTCQTCGNDIAVGITTCPFCGEAQETHIDVVPVAAPFHKVVNIEQGRPFVAGAMQKLEAELTSGRRQNLRVLTVIHGYGSSGKGGAIGVECRKVLAYLQGTGEIKSVIHGEDFRQKSGKTRDLLRRFPQLATNVNLNKGNRGITIVVL